jgi:transcriptional regulator with GAF, ATPase, and Fis domain
VITISGNTLHLSELLKKQEKVHERQHQFSSTLPEVEKENIQHTLRYTDWRIEGHCGASTLLGLAPGTLRARMRKLWLKRTTP